MANDGKNTGRRDTLVILGFLVLVCGTAIFALYQGATPADIAVIGFVAFSAVIVAFAAVVLWQIIDGRIDLFGIIAEPQDVARIGDKPKASLSRFQFLLFTFVIAGLFLMLSIESGSFVNVPDSVLILLGLSGGGFIVSKSVGFRATPPPGNAAPARGPATGDIGGTGTATETATPSAAAGARQ